MQKHISLVTLILGMTLGSLVGGIPNAILIYLSIFFAGYIFGYGIVGVTISKPEIRDMGMRKYNSDRVSFGLTAGLIFSGLFGSLMVFGSI